MDNRKCNEYIGAITVCTSQLVTLKQLKRLWPLALQTLQRYTQIDIYKERERECEQKKIDFKIYISTKR